MKKEIRFNKFLLFVLVITELFTIISCDVEGIAPEIHVKQDTIDLPDENGSYDFGNVVADGDGGITSEYILFTIENTGDKDLIIASISINLGDTDDFDLIDNTISPLAASSTTTFTIRFDPLTIGEKSAIVTIANNDYNEGTYTFTITGMTPGAHITDTTGSIGFDLHYIPAGTFYVGINPPGGNNVTLTRDYWMAETEVTYELWYEVYTWATGNGYWFATIGTMGDGSGDTDQHPVTEISWRDCIVWCNALSEREGLTPVYTYSGDVLKYSDTLACDFADFDYNASGYRLPTEAEWEIAARGAIIGVEEGTYGTDYSGSDTIGDVAWYDGNTTSTHVVGTKACNELHIYDMTGNVWEMCWDWEGSPCPSAEINPVGAGTGTQRIIRGGSFTSLSGTCTVFNRGDVLPYNDGYNRGFRLVRNK